MKFFKIFLGLAISGVCLYLSVRSLDFHSLIEPFATIKVEWVCFSMGGILASQWIRGQRWARLLKPLYGVSFLSAFRIYAIGNLANLLIPLRGGDLLRVWIMARRLSSPEKGAILATVITERLCDMIIFGFLLGLALLLYPLPSWITLSGILLFLGSLGVGALLGIFKVKPQLLKRGEVFFKTFIPAKTLLKLKGVCADFLKGVTLLSSRREHLLFFLETFLMWASQGVCIYVLFYSFGFTQTYDLGVNATLLMLALTTLAVAVPSSPGYVGTFHLMCVVSLEICGLSQSEAFSYGLVYHGVCTVMSLFLGVPALLHEHVSLSSSFNRRNV